MIALRPYQELAVEGLRQGLRDGHRCQILCSPTGSGKTVIGAYLLQEVQAKGRKAAFVVDRVALCGQTSRVLWDYGIQHGIAQGQNSFGRHEPIQVCSSQTIEKRGFLPDLDLMIVDEAHTQRKFIVNFAKNSKIPIIGLTATPFSKGLGATYSNVVNVTTTDELIEQKYLAPLVAYAAKEIDMTGAKVVAGEWTDREVEERGREIIGDIVKEWVEKTNHHFGGPVKTIGFSATVAHGEEICREFQAAGYDFRQISYKDRDDDYRADLIQQFRDGQITGLVSCEALAKGFDVPDVLCLISARPYRKSFSSHIQQIGRAMRASPGKEYALVLDHCGNFTGFLDRMDEFFANGVYELDDGERDSKVREEGVKEKTDIVCACGYVLKPSMDTCPACGAQRKRKNTIETKPGVMVEVERGKEKPVKPYLKDPEVAWGGICHIAMLRKKGDVEAAKKFALAQYRNFYDEWPDRSWGFAPAEFADPGLASHIKANLIRYAKRRAA